MTDSQRQAPSTHSGQALQEELQFKQAIKMAQELGQLYKQSRKLKEDLAEEKIMLDYRRREVQTLNKLLQQQLNESLRIQEAYYSLLDRLHRLLAETSDNGNLRRELKRMLRQELERTSQR